MFVMSAAISTCFGEQSFVGVGGVTSLRAPLAVGFRIRFFLSTAAQPAMFLPVSTTS